MKIQFFKCPTFFTGNKYLQDTIDSCVYGTYIYAFIIENEVRYFSLDKEYINDYIFEHRIKETYCPCTLVCIVSHRN